LKRKTTFNTIVLSEPIAKGQFISGFTIVLKNKRNAVKEITGTTVGNKRIITFPAITADAIEIKIKGLRGKPSLDRISLYNINSKLQEHTE
jgi:alpha-L-fucosidase